MAIDKTADVHRPRAIAEKRASILLILKRIHVFTDMLENDFGPIDLRA
jgi:hypothetical protein